MFGYVSINKPELKVREYIRYHAFYCGLCKTLKERYGLVGEMTLTYDMTFLVMLLNALYEPKETMGQERCVLHPVKKHDAITCRFSAYGADMNVLLMYYKELDDWQDDGSPQALAVKTLLEKKIKALTARYPHQTRTIQDELRYLKHLETENIRDLESAARSFGRLLGTFFVYQDDFFKENLYKVGYYLGIYIYLADAWQDREEDLKNGSYNPLPDPIPEHTVEEEGRAFQRLLEEVMARCASYFERLPVIKDAEILRNILYAGVWTSLYRGKSDKNLKNRIFSDIERTDV